MSGTYFYTAVISFSIGIGLQSAVPVTLPSILLLLLMSFGLAVVWKRSGAGASAPYVLLGSIIFLSLSLGLLRTEVSSWQFGVSELEQVLQEEITFTGVVIKEPDVREQSMLLTVANETDRILISTNRLAGISYGDEVAASGRLTKPQPFETDLGRTFDYPAYLKVRGVEYQISFAEVEVLRSSQGNVFLAGLLQTKYAFMDRLELVLPEPQVGLAQGLLLGVKQALGEAVEEDFRRTGIIHIVVLSGYNVMLVVAFFIYVFSFFLSPKKRVVGGVIAITCFALLVGLSATVVRASIMASLLLFAQGFGQSYNVLRALFFAGAVMLVLNPYLLLYDIGFQLSFMATLGLLFITPQFESTVITSESRLKIKDFFFATLATQIAVLPLLLFHIGEVSLLAVVVNVLVLPIVPVAMLLTFITGLIAFVSIPLAGAIGYLAYGTLSYILFAAYWFAELPFAAVSVPTFSALGVLGSYFLLGAVLYVLYTKHHRTQFSDWTIEEEKTSPLVSSETSGEVQKNVLPKIFR